MNFCLIALTVVDFLLCQAVLLLQLCACKLNSTLLCNKDLIIVA